LFFGQFTADFASGQLRIGEQLVEAAFQFAQIAANRASKKLDHLFRHMLVRHGRQAMLENVATQFKAGGLDVGNQAHRQAREQALIDSVQCLWRTIRGHHHALALADQGIDRVEKFLLGRIFADDELDVIHHQQVGFAQ